MSASRLCRSCLPRSLPLRTYSTSTSTAASSSSTQPARLRFAPSPTGYLHLGGLRTALFNHLYARALNGQWILRIEDTDQTRLVPGSVAALQDTLAWAKLDYDEGPDIGGSHGPYLQSERLDLYRSYAERLIAEGKAYRDFRAEVTSDDSARTKHVPLRDSYIPPSESEAKHLISLGKRYVVRLRVPGDALDHTDLVYGAMHFPADPQRCGTDDPILLKSNGWPTYHLANVVDDHEMRISHVLRGEEWLPSLPKHLWLYRALGWTPPHFAHLPLLVNADGTKLSKRTGDVRVESYREKGFEPEALTNFLGLMGYNNLAYHNQQQQHSGSTTAKQKVGEKEEDATAYDVLTMAEMVRGFDIAHVNRSRATVDLAKLYFLNARHVALKLEDQRTGGGRDELVAKLTPHLSAAFPELASTFSGELVGRVLELTRGSVATLNEVPAAAEVLFRRPDLAKAQGVFKRNAMVHAHFTAAVDTALTLFAQLNPEEWTRDAIQDVITKLPKSINASPPPPAAEGQPGQGANAPKTKLKKAAVLAPLRFALSAREKGAPLADLCLFLGRDECMHRLSAAQNAVERGDLTA